MSVPQAVLFTAADLVFVALLILMARIYFYGLRLAKNLLIFIGMMAGGALIVFTAAMVIDDPWAWGGPAVLATGLLFAAFLAPASTASSALAIDRNEPPGMDAIWPIDDEAPSRAPQMGLLPAPPEQLALEEGSLDYRHFVLDREANMFLHRPGGSRRSATCYVSELDHPESAVTLDDLVNRAENHICWSTEPETRLMRAVQ